MRILVLGDLRGHAGRGTEGQPLAARPLLRVDVDNFAQMLARLAPEIEVPVGSGSATLGFRALDDFHPDEIYRRVSAFQTLRELRGRLLDPATFPAAAADLRAAASALPPTGTELPAVQPPTGDEDDAATVERLLGRQPAEPVAPSPAKGAVEGLIRDAVAPHIRPGPDPFQPVYLAAADDAVGDQMRAILHDPGFQALEAAWRSVHSLVTHLETGEDLELHLLHVTREELRKDLLRTGTAPEGTDLHGLLVDRQAGEAPWSVLVGDYRFGPGEDDLELLGALGAVASRTGGPFLAAADPGLLGCRSLAETPEPEDWTPLEGEAAARWQALRRSPVAPWLGLALPRVLLRLPYGKGGEETEGFVFEELGPEGDHEAYLWGNPAFACALLLAEGFRDRGWEMEPGDRLQMEGLPAHTYKAEGEVRLKPCAEVCLGERAGEAILGRGPMPLLSFRNRNAVRLLRFQSLAAPPAPLAGAWT